MSENQPVESIELPEEITDESIQDFIDRGGEAPSYHPILQIWQSILSNAPAEAKAPISPGWATRIVQSFPEIRFADMPRFQELLYAKIARLSDIVDEVVSSDDECLNVFTVEDDLEHNSGHYKTVLKEWQKEIARWELDWDCTSPDAAFDHAASAEAHRMFLGQNGLTAYLDNIRLEYTEADQEELLAELNAMKEGR